MSDTLTTDQRSERMRRIKGQDTGPEMVVRRLVHGMGFRYRLHRRDIPGNPDLVFPSRWKAIFVHGCFWHRHPDPSCNLARMPKSRRNFWVSKLEKNRARDIRKQRELEEMGWEYLIIWECQIGRNLELKNKIHDFLVEADGENS